MKAASLTIHVAIVGAFLISSIGTLGCQNLNKTQNGALLGTLLGAGTGAVIGHQSGNRDEGAIIGAAAGAIGGALLGQAEEQADQRDAALAYAHHSEMNRRADLMAVTNRDIIEMTQQEFSDEHILTTIKHRGGRFDTSPSAQGRMKQVGVSEKVLSAMMGIGI